MMTKKSVYKAKRVRKATPSVKMVKAIVKREIAKDVENKENSITTGFGFYQYSTTSITSVTAGNLVPSIAQGTSEQTRIGNNIKVKKFMLRGYLRLNATGLSGETLYSPNQYNVRIFIGRLKLSNSTPITANYNSLLRVGASTFPFDSGSGLSLVRSINTEDWTIYYDKIHKIGVSQPRIIGSTTNQDYTTVSGIANNDYKLSKILKIDCTKMIKQKLVFSDAGTFPTNTGLYMFGGCVDSLTSDVTLSGPPVVFDVDIEMSYEDA